jgi:hypothetical protein
MKQTQEEIYILMRLTVGDVFFKFTDDTELTALINTHSYMRTYRPPFIHSH